MLGIGDDVLIVEFSLLLLHLHSLARYIDKSIVRVLF